MVSCSTRLNWEPNHKTSLAHVRRRQATIRPGAGRMPEMSLLPLGRVVPCQGRDNTRFGGVECGVDRTRNGDGIRPTIPGALNRHTFPRGWVVAGDVLANHLQLLLYTEHRPRGLKPAKYLPTPREKH